MTCHEARELLSAAVDDALGGAERERLDAHLATCTECRRELQRVRDTVALLRTVEPACAPAGFVDRVLAARPAPWPRRLLHALFLPWSVKLPLEAAATVLIAVGVVYLYRATPEIERAARLESPAPTVAQAPRADAPESRAPSPATPPEAPGKKLPGASGAKRDETARGYVPPPPTAPRDLRRESDQRRDQQSPGTYGEPSASADIAAKSKREAPPPARAEREAETRERAGRLAPAAPAPEQPAAGALRARQQAPVSLVPPDVSGVLAVDDRETALRALADLVARLGGVEDRRLPASDAAIVELSIPRDVYPEFSRRLRHLGRWQPAREPAELPARVRVVLRITG